MSDLSTTISTYGKTVVVLNQWRNANATAFASVTIHQPHAYDVTIDAKSQGPSAGGYSKPHQAMERLSAKLGQPYGSELEGLAQRSEEWCQCVARIGEIARLEGYAPPWKVGAK